MQSPLTLLHFEFCVPRLSHVSVHVLSMIDKKQLKLNEKKLNVILDSLFHYGAPYHIETSPFICYSNQCTGFYVIGTSVMEELTNLHQMQNWEKMG